MDFTTLEPIKGSAFLHLKSPLDGELLYDKGEDGKPDLSKKVGIDILGIDSDVFKQHQRQSVDENIESAFKNKGRPKLNSEKIEMRDMKTLVACTTGVHYISLDGVPVGAKPEEIRKLYERFDWVKEQVNEGIADRSLFIKTLPTS